MKKCTAIIVAFTLLMVLCGCNDQRDPMLKLEEAENAMRTYLDNHEEELTEIATQMLEIVDEGEILHYQDRTGALGFTPKGSFSFDVYDAPDLLAAIQALDNPPFTYIATDRYHYRVNVDTCVFETSIFDGKDPFCRVELTYAEESEYELAPYTTIEELRPNWFLYILFYDY